MTCSITSQWETWMATERLGSRARVGTWEEPGATTWGGYAVIAPTNRRRALRHPGPLERNAGARRDSNVGQDLQWGSGQARSAQARFCVAAILTAAAARASMSKSRVNTSRGTSLASQSNSCWTGRRVPSKQGFRSFGPDQLR